MAFQGSYKTTALKMKVEDFYRAMHRGNRRTRGRMISLTEDDVKSRPLRSKADLRKKPVLQKRSQAKL